MKRKYLVAIISVFTLAICVYLVKPYLSVSDKVTDVVFSDVGSDMKVSKGQLSYKGNGFDIVYVHHDVCKYDNGDTYINYIFKFRNKMLDVVHPYNVCSVGCYQNGERCEWTHPWNTGYNTEIENYHLGANPEEWVIACRSFYIKEDVDVVIKITDEYSGGDVVAEQVISLD